MPLFEYEGITGVLQWAVRGTVEAADLMAAGKSLAARRVHAMAIREVLPSGERVTHMHIPFKYPTWQDRLRAVVSAVLWNIPFVLLLWGALGGYERLLGLPPWTRFLFYAAVFGPLLAAILYLRRLRRAAKQAHAGSAVAEPDSAPDRRGT